MHFSCQPPQNQTFLLSDSLKRITLKKKLNLNISIDLIQNELNLD